MKRTASIEILGADANNLRSIDLRLPLNAVTMVVGVSGSGKSSLLDDTLAEEAERRVGEIFHVPTHGDTAHESRAFVGRLPPSIHVGQREFRASVRTTVGTASGLLSLLRRLFLEHAHPYADDIGEDVPSPSPESYADWLFTHYRGPIEIWAVPVFHQTTDGVAAVRGLRERGATTIVVTTPDATKATRSKAPKPTPIERFRPLDRRRPHVIEAPMGSVNVGDNGKQRRKELLGLLRRAFAAGAGRIVVQLPKATDTALASEHGPRLHSDEHWLHPGSPRVFAPPSRHLLSFNAPEHASSGACPVCRGLGRARTVTESALVKDPNRSMHDGALRLWTEKNYKYVGIQHDVVEGLWGIGGFDPDVPWRKLSSSARKLILDGSEELVVPREPKTGRKAGNPMRFIGFRRAILERLDKPSGKHLQSFAQEGPCPACAGSRWSPEALALRVGGHSIADFLGATMAQLEQIFASKSSFAKALPAPARRYLPVLQRLASGFVGVGLGHLSPARGVLDISQGESRRLQLASIFATPGSGWLLLLDEPARGLHEADLDALASALTSLGQRHTVILNEHRERLAVAADHMLELGPGAGPAGGQVVYSGEPRRSPAPNSARATLPVTAKTPRLRIEGATLHAMQDVTVELPLGRLISLAGLSGSGKSNFVRGVLVPALCQALDLKVDDDEFRTRQEGRWSRISGARKISGLVALDHRLPAPNRRSIVATFLDVAPTIRAAYAATAAARSAGLKKQDFGFNSGAGRCTECLGLGYLEEDALKVVCSRCGGSRLEHFVAEVELDGGTLPDLLRRPISELDRTAQSLAPFKDLLEAIESLGIGHISLDRPIDTLSGGEVQRLRIAMRLARHDGGGLLFVMDEPAAGLHPTDVGRLLKAIDRIVDGGRNSVVLVEHNLSLLRASDWIVEFGPGSGPEGGRVIAAGSPGAVAKKKTPTGTALRVNASRVHPRHTTAPKIGKSEQAGARTALATFRRLRGDDVRLVEEPDDDVDANALAVVLDEAWLADRRFLEIGGMDYDFAQLALAEQRQRLASARAQLLATWSKRGGRLAVIPYLDDLATWDGHLPRSAHPLLEKRAKELGLRLEPAKGANEDNGLRGSRTEWEGETGLRRALAMGAGYVELRTDAGVLETVADRTVDLDRAIVGPRRMEPEHLSRRHRFGSCPMCKGRGNVPAVPEALLFAKRSAPIEADGLLTPQALDAVRGARRSDLLPLVERLRKDGLWSSPKSASIARLSDEERSWLLFGCWMRPGHGTYARKGKDPSEVGAWIRWDGLHAHVLAELGRIESKHARWAKAVREQTQPERCPRCDGSGLRRFTRVTTVLGRSVHDWVTASTTQHLAKALQSARFPEARDEARRKRLLVCARVAAAHAPRARLSDVPATAVGLAIAKAAVAELSTVCSVEA